jgi:quercetin dioxygenase-like cupin family protein
VTAKCQSIRVCSPNGATDRAEIWGNAMTLIRRELLQAAGVLVAIPTVSQIVFAQAPAGPKLTQILKKDVEGQDQKVEETIVSIVEFGPGVAAPWHMHPSAQEMLYALDGNLVVEIEGRGSAMVKLGEASIIPGDIPHLARNDTSATVKALVLHTRGAKDKPFVVPVRR